MTQLAKWLSRPVALAVVVLWTSFLQSALAQEWRPVGGGILQGISGMALVAQHRAGATTPTRTTYLVVHDNKKKEEARLALVTIQGDGPPQYRALPWPGSNPPVDLEALTSVPGQAGSFMAVASAGTIYHIRLNATRTAVALVKVLNLPNVPKGSNFEGFALQSIGGVILAVWADRGADKRPAILYWSRLDLITYKFSPVGSLPLRAPWPLSTQAAPAAEVRHVSDLKVDATGALFVSSASDPGDDGPFQSALYLAGVFSINRDQITVRLSPNPLLLGRFSYHKIEAVDLVPGSNGGIVFATDDENMGSSIYPDW
jgi:hypothetical protein